MTDAELEAVRQRAEKARCHAFGGETISGEVLPDLEDVLAAVADVPALLAEVERLRRKNAHLRALLDAEGRP